MRAFLQWTAWPMVPPKAYGPFHITFFLVGLTVSILLAWKLRKTTESQNKAVLLTVGLLLAIFELYKQLFYTYIIGEGAYQWWIFPFQLCSVPMYLCILAAFLPDCKVRNSIFHFMLAFNLMGGFVSFLEPSGLCHGYWSLTIHAFSWHMALVFIGLYLGFSRRAGVRKADFGGTVRTFLILAGAAFLINLLLWKPSGGDINMFFVGPAQSSIIVFHDIAGALGWYVNTPIYLACMCLGGYLFYMPFCLWNQRLERKKKQEEAVR